MGQRGLRPPALNRSGADDEGHLPLVQLATYYGPLPSSPPDIPEKLSGRSAKNLFRKVARRPWFLCAPGASLLPKGDDSERFQEAAGSSRMKGSRRVGGWLQWEGGA